MIMEDEELQLLLHLIRSLASGVDCERHCGSANLLSRFFGEIAECRKFADSGEMKTS